MDPAHGAKVLIPYSNIPGIGSFIEDRVASVGVSSLQLESGVVIKFDWLMLCPGSTYADGPIKNFKGSVDDRQAVIQVSKLPLCVDLGMTSMTKYSDSGMTSRGLRIVCHTLSH